MGRGWRKEQSSLGRCGISWTRTGGGQIGASGKQRKPFLLHTSETSEVAWEHPLCPGTNAKAQLLSQISSEKQQKQSSSSAKVWHCLGGARQEQGPKVPPVTTTMMPGIKSIAFLQVGEGDLGSQNEWAGCRSPAGQRLPSLSP